LSGGSTGRPFVAGQTPRDCHGNCVGKGDMRAQIEQVGQNIKDALERAGATLADVVKTTTYVTDMTSISGTRTCACAISRRRCRPAPRAGGAAVVPPEFMVEIEAFAIV
jgi:enamine deaminase RidA (YjgF/YER057c/UK114 family)